MLAIDTVLGNIRSKLFTRYKLCRNTEVSLFSLCLFSFFQTRFDYINRKCIYDAEFFLPFNIQVNNIVLLHNGGFCNACITKRCLHNLQMSYL
jgi:hypothetical protein